MNAIFKLDAMDRSSFENALEEQKRLLKARAEIDQRLKLVDDYIQLHQKLFSESVDVRADVGIPGPEATQRRRQRNALSPQSIGRYARDFIVKAGSPLTRGELLRLFEENGVPIVGSDKAKVLGTTLWRLKNSNGDPVFISTGDGYWPSDKPLPSAT